MLPTFEDAERDPRALYRSLRRQGSAGLSPFEDEQYKRLLGEHADERLRRTRETEDEASGSDPGRAFMRSQQDGATGASGFNRPWVPFQEALRGDNVKWASSGLPMHQETSFPTDAMTSLMGSRPDPTDDELARLKSRSSLRDQPAMRSLQRGR